MIDYFQLITQIYVYNMKSKILKAFFLGHGIYMTEKDNFSEDWTGKESYSTKDFWSINICND